MENRIAPVPVGTPTQTPNGKTFIGGKAAEFNRSTRTSPQEESSSEKVALEPIDQKCSACGDTNEPDSSFCSSCGTELGIKGIEESLGVEFTDDDISEYLFKGYIAKEIPLFRDKMAVMKTLLPKEASAAEDFVVAHFQGKEATQSQWSNVDALTYLSFGWTKFDGNSLGGTQGERYATIEGTIGVHLLDIASKKWSLLNRAVTELLEGPKVKNS